MDNLESNARTLDTQVVTLAGAPQNTYDQTTVDLYAILYTDKYLKENQNPEAVRKIVETYIEKGKLATCLTKGQAKSLEKAGMDLTKAGKDQAAGLAYQVLLANQALKKSKTN